VVAPVPAPNPAGTAVAAIATATTNSSSTTVVPLTIAGYDVSSLFTTTNLLIAGGVGVGLYFMFKGKGSQGGRA
jgi:hypothetical protein